MARILVTEKLAERGLDQMRAAGHDVDVQLGLEPSALLDAVKGAHALVIRSATKVTAGVLEAGTDLVVVGRAGVGVDNVDVEAATRLGVMVANAPLANVLTNAEHTMALLLSMARNIPQAHSRLKSGTWERARWEGVELYGKTLAILGLGRVGALVAQRANAFGMRLLAWDKFVDADRARKMGVVLVDDLDQIAAEADFVALGLVKRPEYMGILGDDFFSKCKPNLRVINNARGGLVDEDALARAIADGRVAGAALDVFADEPKEGQAKESPLFALDSVVVTPHLGASTTEAQDKAGETIAEQVLLALAGDFVPYAVNVDAGEAGETVRSFLGLAERLGKLIAGLTKGELDQVEVEYQGQLAQEDTRLLDLSILRGLLSGLPDAPPAVSFVNASSLAADRGLTVSASKATVAEDYVNLLTLRAGEHEVAGTFTGPRGEARIVNISGHGVDVPLAEHLLVVRNDDRPGVIGAVGTTLGDAGINIAGIHVGRSVEGTALMVLATDTDAGDQVIEQLRSTPGILGVREVTLA